MIWGIPIFALWRCPLSLIQPRGDIARGGTKNMPLHATVKLPAKRGFSPLLTMPLQPRTSEEVREETEKHTFNTFQPSACQGDFGKAMLCWEHFVTDWSLSSAFLRWAQLCRNLGYAEDLLCRNLGYADIQSSRRHSGYKPPSVLLGCCPCCCRVGWVTLARIE